jgi:protoporphyrin/coproporphyrin ferrochelatase
MSTKKTGILLTNTGSPNLPTPAAVRRYLREFLSDKRVVKLSRILWLPILYGIILPFRAKKSAKLYQKIWLDDKKIAPLLFHTHSLAKILEQHLRLPVAFGMHYGNHSIGEALENFRCMHLERIVILPLFPQYSGICTGAAFDRVQKTISKWYWLPEIHFISGYAMHPAYINAICRSIQIAFKNHGKKYLLFSFHGIPEKYAGLGDPYPLQCAQTMYKITDRLGLAKNEYGLAFQSRLGKGKWLMPYTDVILKSLPKRGIRDVHVICPGFAVDCLETLEEIALRGKEQFMQAGGNSFNYIPALNNEVSCFLEILQKSRIL